MNAGYYAVQLGEEEYMRGRISRPVGGIAILMILTTAGFSIGEEEKAAGGDTTARPLTVDDYFRILNVDEPRISPDGKWVAYTVTTSDLEKDEEIAFLREELIDRRGQIKDMKGIIDGQNQLLEAIQTNVAPIFKALAATVETQRIKLSPGKMFERATGAGHDEGAGEPTPERAAEPQYRPHLDDREDQRFL